jgi:hypothetical protein
LRQQACDLFVQPDEKSYFAIRTPQLCGVAFIIEEKSGFIVPNQIIQEILH